MTNSGEFPWRLTTLEIFENKKFAANRFVFSLVRFILSRLTPRNDIIFVVQTNVSSLDWLQDREILETVELVCSVTNRHTWKICRTTNV